MGTLSSNITGMYVSYDELVRYNREKEMDIKKIKPLMFKCESEEWINLQYMDYINIVKHSDSDSNYLVYYHSITERSFKLKSGLESIEKAEEYIDKLLTALLAFN